MSAAGAAGVLLGAVAATAASPGPAPAGRERPAAVSAAACEPGPMPYRGLAGAALVPEVHASRDRPPVRYVRWRGTVPSFDGLPLSVDVTVPCGATGPQPTVTMLHGFIDDKTVWQETGRNDRITSADRPEANSRWNNIWFAARGYTVINYTARGWRDSCGPDTPGATPLTPAPHCLAYQYWIHLDDKRWEVRDAQWLAGGLVQSGHADPARLAVTGGSYGGAPTAMAALLAGSVMCGATPVPAALGPDPCAGRADGALAPWRTPDGTRRLTWAAAVPMYTYGDLIQVLAPNGRVTDGWEHAPAPGDPTEPFGVPTQSTVAGLLAAGATAGFFAPPGVDPTADIVTDTARLLAGNPFPRQDPLVARGVRLYREFKSPSTSPPGGRVPIFWVQGFTDPLFPAWEALTILRNVRAHDAGYPFKLFLGDLGHDYTGQRQDEWDLVKAQMNGFLDHYLRPDRSPEPPRSDVGATITRCLDHDAPLHYVAAPTWHDLHPRHATLTGTATGVISTAIPGPAALATDPITTATLPLPGSYRGCRIMRPSQPDPTAVTQLFPVAHDTVLLGGPVVEVTFSTTAPDVPLSARLWHVTPDGSAQGLVTRGTYRVATGPGTYTARFQLAPQGYRFPAGHTLKLEVVANDAPYLQASNIPAVVTVQSVTLTVPLYEPSPPAAGAAIEEQGQQSAAAGTLAVSGGPTSAWMALLLLAMAGIGRAALRSADNRVRA